MGSNVCLGGKGGARVGYPTGARRARRVDDAGWGRGKGEEGNPAHPQPCILNKKP